MADASSIRSAKVNPSATGRNRGSIRYNSTSNTPVYSDGTNWNNFKNAVPAQVCFKQNLAAEIAGRVFYVATRPVRVKSISSMHAVASGNTSTIQVVKCSTGQTVNNGTNLLSTAFLTNKTVNTIDNGSLVTTPSDLLLVPGDRLAMNLIGAKGSLAGLAVTVELEQFESTRTISVPLSAATGQTLFTAPVAMTITGVKVAYSTASTSGTLTLSKDTGTTAAGAGTAILASTVSLAATANTGYSGALVTTEDTLVLDAGDRLGLVLAGTLTNLDGLIVSVDYRAIDGSNYEMTQVVMPAAADCTDRLILLTNRPVYVKSASYVATAAGTSGSAVTMNIEKETGSGAGAAAPAGGSTTLLQSAFDLKATENTVQAGTLTATTANLILTAGQRISIEETGTTTAVANATITVGYLYI